MVTSVYSGTLLFDDNVKIDADLHHTDEAVDFHLAFDWPPNNRRYSAHAVAKFVKISYVTSKFHCKELLTGDYSEEFSSFKFSVKPEGRVIRVEGQMRESGHTHFFSGSLNYVRSY